jgi:hypothetical protein
MRVLHCPRCRQITEQLESFGSCEHCGADAVTAGETIETEGPDPAIQAAAWSRWRWFTSGFWLAAVLFELAYVALRLLLAFNLRDWNLFRIDPLYPISAAALTAIAGILAIAVGAFLFEWRWFTTLTSCAAALFAASCGASFFLLRSWVHVGVEPSPLGIAATVLANGAGLAISIAAIFWPIPSTLVGLVLYSVWIVGDLVTNPAASCLTVFRLFLLVGLTIGLGFCIKYRD